MAPPVVAAEAETRYLWPSHHRAFLDDGPGWLLTAAQRDAFAAASEEERGATIVVFFADPDPSTERNQLQAAIDRRLALVRHEFSDLLDERARVLFLKGPPAEREVIACDQTFVPLEIWRYGNPEEPKLMRQFVLYEPAEDEPWRLWLPLDSKRVLYGKEMGYWMLQVAEITGGRTGPRFDKQLCRQVRKVDRATGIEALYGFEKNRPSNADVLKLFEPPADRGRWAREALSTPLPPDLADRLQVETPEVYFPERQGQRMVSRMLLRIPVEAGLGVFEQDLERELRVKLEGHVERDGQHFESFYMRYQVPVEGEAPELALVFERLLRSEDDFLVRVKVIDEIGGAVAHTAVGFRVPNEPEDHADLPPEVTVAQGEVVMPERVAGVDSLVIIPPETDVVIGLWRVETLIAGEQIRKVVFLLDGKAQMTRSRRPFEAELRLAKYPTEQIVSVEGYDADGDLIASDEVILNQQRGQLEVKILDPKAGGFVTGSVLARASVVVPEEKQISKVEFKVNDELQASLVKPPWQAEIEAPEVRGQGDVSYLTVSALLGDGTMAEDVMFLNQPDYLEEVEVDLVELYTTVEGDPNQSLSESDFTVTEDGRRQNILRFELVEDLPITIGITIDTSGSMIESLAEAKTAAVDFLDNIITPKDQSFAVSFSNFPILLMTRTSDVGAVETALEDLHAVGNTALHDAIVTSLYYFRGVRGRRALVLLSDGEDTASGIPFKDSLDYARRSGVSIYTIGLNIGRTQMGIRGNLNQLAKETGGRSFFIRKASELQTIYAQIDKELRSQYLLAYSSDAAQDKREFRTVQVKVKGRLKARTISGYYP
ncbi:MAG: VWA domain-containing protein [Acidobacteriota bacterium]|nr:VWA domain-containing protein [Acidobacteriota bacterium]